MQPARKLTVQRKLITGANIEHIGFHALKSYSIPEKRLQMTHHERAAYDQEMCKSPVTKRNDQGFKVLKQRIPSAKLRVMSAGRARKTEPRIAVKQVVAESSSDEMAI